MNKSDLVKALMESAQIPINQAETVVTRFFDSITRSLAEGTRVEIRGFGSFAVREHGGYVGRNPRTGEPIDVPPKRLPYFRAGKELKERTNAQS
ncbi:MAG: integration host factor subunit beta [Desulfovibrio sp.]|nr:integration host factor subunit beta [Desulfovibrio sp.]